VDRDQEIRALLAEIGKSGRGAVDKLVPIVYEELRMMARRHLRGERPDHTLNTTGLVHEAYVRLVSLDRMSWQNRAHFLAVAAQAMRRVLVDYAAVRKTQKRGGRRQRVPLDESMLQADRPAEQLLAIDTALQRLNDLNPRLSRVIECRFFAGMSIEETAEVLNLSPATVKRDWHLARAWLNRELSEQRS
jgi:RNA polymerase sigma-70 factor, ECF subfamily